MYIQFINYSRFLWFEVCFYFYILWNILTDFYLSQIICNIFNYN